MSARRHPLPLPEATSRALHPLRAVLNELNSGKRLNRKQTIGFLEGAVEVLKLGLKSEIVAATGDLSSDLLRALELAALPPKIDLGRPQP